MSDLTPDEVRARAIIDNYVHTVTGMTPEHRFAQHIKATWGRVTDVFSRALAEFMKPLNHAQKEENNE